MVATCSIRTLFLAGMIVTIVITWGGSARGASANSLQITEVHAQPESGFPEWIEIHNSAEYEVDIAGWSLEDVLSSPSTIHTFPANTVLMPNQYLVVELTGSKLNNAADGVILKDSTLVVIDQMSYTQSDRLTTWQKAGSEWCQASATPGMASACTISASPISSPPPIQSWVATPTPQSGSPTTASQSGDPQTVLTPHPSPTPPSLPASTAQPVSSSVLSLQVTEISPCPQDSKEWIEFYNPNSFDVLVDAYILTDAQGNKRSLSGDIEAKGYGVLHVSSSILNNAGDTAQISDGNNRVLAKVSYELCAGGNSLSLFDSTWEWGEPSPGKPNHRASAQKETTAIDTDTTSPSVVASVQQNSGSNTSVTQPPLVNPVLPMNAATAPETDKRESSTALSADTLDLPVWISSSSSALLKKTVATNNNSLQYSRLSLESRQLHHRLPATLVIMGGSILVLVSSSLYVSLITDIRLLAQRLTTTGIMGKFHLPLEFSSNLAKR